ncbi:MAG: FAD-binding oxidoreductase [bacterium]|nr:FAD-binding oxidoreductase [bacterium]
MRLCKVHGYKPKKTGRPAPSLRGAHKADVVIIGSGLTGTTAAYLLSKAGADVTLITDETIGNSTSAYTTGFITQSIDTNLADLEKMFGSENAGMIWQSGRDAIEHIEATAHEEEIACEFLRCPYYIYATNDTEYNRLMHEATSARMFGFEAYVRRDNRLPFPNGGYLELSAQAKFHALKYLAGLRAAARKYGVRVFDNTKAESIEEEGDRFLVHVKNGSAEAPWVLIATEYPFNNPWRLFARTGRYLTYIIESEIAKRRLPEALYQDVKNPYHYFRVDSGKKRDRLIFGGEDHRHEIMIDQRKIFSALKEFMRTIVPDERLPIRTKWKWSIIEPIDGLPFIGPLGSGQPYVATGYSGTGITMSRIAAEMFTDHVRGVRNPWTELYNPRRIPTLKQLLVKGLDYTGEFMGGAAKNMLRRQKT